MACTNYESCRKKENKTLAYPMDVNSLYSDRNYDMQTENQRCYQYNPITIVEGFGSWFGQLLKIVLFVLLIVLIISLVNDYSKETIVVNVPEASVVEISEIEVKGMKGGFL